MPEVIISVKVVEYSANLQEVEIEKDEQIILVQRIDRPVTIYLSRYLYNLQSKYSLEMYPHITDIMGYSMQGFILPDDYQILMDIIEGKRKYNE